MSSRRTDPLKTLRDLHKSCNRGQSCIVARCRRGACNIVLPETGALCIDCDLCDAFSELTTEKKPDFVVLFATMHPLRPETLVWFVIEMKTTTSDAGKIVEQLQSGVNAMQ